MTSTDAQPAAPVPLAELLDRHEPLFRSLALRLRTVPEDMDDAMQAARLGFIEAHRRFDPAWGVPIGRYARDFIRDHILRATFRKRPGPKTADLTPEVVEAFGALDPRLEAVEVRRDLQRVAAFVRDLSEVQQQVAYLVGCLGIPPSEVARLRGVSTSAVCKCWRLVREAAELLRDLVEAA